MIGIATVARPDDDGMRNESGRNRKYMRLMKATPPRPPIACSAALSTVSVIRPLFMIDRDAAGDADDERHPEQVAGAVDERRREVGLRHPRDDPDEDREQQE